MCAFRFESSKTGIEIQLLKANFLYKVIIVVTVFLLSFKILIVSNFPQISILNIKSNYFPNGDSTKSTILG